MTIKELSKALCKSEKTIRDGLKQGVYPFGTAFKISGSSRYTYTLYPEKVREYIGGTK